MNSNKDWYSLPLRMKRRSLKLITEAFDGFEVLLEVLLDVVLFGVVVLVGTGGIVLFGVTLGVLA
jgi:hypothetical protein